MTIEERWNALQGRPSGFDYMRIGLSIAVLLWHSYQMSYGSLAALMLWIGPPGLLLQLILPMFFALSGFLVAGSLSRNPKIRVFLSLRAIRIFPALGVEIVLSALVLGPILTLRPLGDYFTDSEFVSYLGNIVGWVHYSLPGVFLANPTARIVNSSLWTIPFELECYILISALMLVGAFTRRRMMVPLFVMTTAAVCIWNSFNGIDASPAGGVDGRILVLCFFGGVVIYTHRDRLPWRFDVAMLALALSILCCRSSALVYLAPLPAAYLTVFVGLLDPPRTIAVEAGDFSYGTYLYAGPIQQTVAQCLGRSGTWTLNVAFALPITVLFALLSWWVVEKPSLKLRHLLKPQPAPAPSSRAPEFDSASADRQFSSAMS